MARRDLRISLALTSEGLKQSLGLVIGTLFSIVPRAARMWTARAYHGRGEHLPVADQKEGGGI